MGRKIEIAGQRFGRLVAVKDIGKDRHRMRVWECRCDCGNTTTARAYDLIRGEKLSCGCLRKDLLVGKREKWARIQESRRKREEVCADFFRPITDEIKDTFNDFWMFGDHPDQQERWFNKVVV